MCHKLLKEAVSLTHAEQVCICTCPCLTSWPSAHVCGHFLSFDFVLLRVTQKFFCDLCWHLYLDLPLSLVVALR